MPRDARVLWLWVAGAILALAGCGSASSEPSMAAGAGPEDFAGSWSFVEQPTASNPVREARITIDSAASSKLAVGGNLETALLEFSISGEGSLDRGKLSVNLSCASENESWSAPATFHVTAEGKLHAAFPLKDGTMLGFDLVKR